MDAVVVAVPPHRHLELTRAALEAGKHVLVEKPAFLAADDYRAVAKLRDETGVGPCWSARTTTTSRSP